MKNIKRNIHVNEVKSIGILKRKGNTYLIYMSNIVLDGEVKLGLFREVLLEPDIVAYSGPKYLEIISPNLLDKHIKYPKDFVKLMTEYNSGDENKWYILNYSPDIDLMDNYGMFISYETFYDDSENIIIEDFDLLDNKIKQKIKEDNIDKKFLELIKNSPESFRLCKKGFTRMKDIYNNSNPADLLDFILSN